MFFFFFFNDTATTEIYTLSLHDALPICVRLPHGSRAVPPLGRLRRAPVGAVREQPDDRARPGVRDGQRDAGVGARSEEHTSELQSRQYLVCRLLLEKKKKKLLTA